MTFHQLKIFCQIVELKSVTRASEHLGIPQPAATRAIRSLESEFGLPLFERSGRGITVNENGRLLYEYARQILDLASLLTTAMSAKKQRMDLTISIVVEAASHLFPHICTAFSARYPQAKFRVLHRDASAGLGGEDYPLRLFSSRERPDQEDTVVLAEEEIRLAVPRGGPFGKRQEIALAEVADLGFVSLFKTRGLRQITDHYCKLAGFEPNIIFETDNTTTVTRYVNSGHGVAFTPDLTWPESSNDEHVHLLSITRPECRRFINLSSRGPASLSRCETLFFDFLVDYFRELKP